MLYPCWALTVLGSKRAVKLSSRGIALALDTTAFGIKGEWSSTFDEQVAELTMAVCAGLSLNIL